MTRQRQPLTKLHATIKDDAALHNQMIELSKDGHAWISIIRPFSHDVTFMSFETPSRVPDRFYELSRGEIAWKGRIRGFTKSAIIREQNRGLTSD